jgi:hypothetical protein
MVEITAIPNLFPTLSSTLSLSAAIACCGPCVVLVVELNSISLSVACCRFSIFFSGRCCLLWILWRACRRIQYHFFVSHLLQILLQKFLYPGEPPTRWILICGRIQDHFFGSRHLLRIQRHVCYNSIEWRGGDGNDSDWWQG